MLFPGANSKCSYSKLVGKSDTIWSSSGCKIKILSGFLKLEYDDAKTKKKVLFSVYLYS